MRKSRFLAAILATGLALGALSGCADGSPDGENKPTEFAESDSKDVLNIYSSRHYDVDKEVYAKFEEETGIKINLVEGKSGELVERISREVSSPKADLFLTVGAESISQLREAKALGEYQSEKVTKNIPEHYRGDGWMGIVSRARVVAYAKDRVNPDDIKTYADLTDEKWQGKILVRSSSSSYNQGLLASFISLWGEEKAKEWAQGVKDNFARDPKGNDRDQAKAVAAGEGDLAIMNSYYFVRMAKSSDANEAEVTKKIGLIFPEDTHVNLSYAGVLANGPHNENAIKFLEFLSDEWVQNIYAEKNGEFPLNPAIALPEIQQSWGEFSTQKLDFNTFGEAKPKAVEIFDQVGWK